MSASKVPTVRLEGSNARAPTSGVGRTPAGRDHEPSLALGRYKLIRRLGSGAFGTVWMAHDERLDREVAVKIVPRERVMGGRFEREARAAARLSHPGIVTLYEAAVDDDAAYLVSELVRGGTLQRLLEAGRLSDRDVVAIASSLCEALSHAHAQGVVHRDVKPSNVLVPARPSTRAYPAKLTDFGIARVIGGDSLTRTGDVVGTAAYMAPEQAEGREAGAAADLYSLALVTYEALTGVNPVRSGTAATRARRLGAHMPPLRRQRRDLPRELGCGIDLALRPRPRERGTLDELRESLLLSLERVADTPGIVAAPWTPRSVDAQGAGQAQEVPDAGDTSRDWPARAVGATAAAATAGWACSHLLTPHSVAPAVFVLLAWVLVVALPRIGWLTMTAAIAAAAALQHRPGGALVLLIAALIPPLLLPRRGTYWPLPALAPALGLVGLAGAWPAFAARITASAWRRAALAATGWLWLVLAAPLAGANLYTRRAPGTPRPDIWTSSLSSTADAVIRPIATSGVLVGALVWALAALVLPWLVTGRSLPRDIVFAGAWATMTVSATEVAIALSSGSHTVSRPPTATIGAVAGALVALAPSAYRGWRQSRSRVNPG